MVNPQSVVSMKLRCPRCQHRLSVPDKYAGRAIRCPFCNRAFRVPTPKAAIHGPGNKQELDLEGLAKLEKSSSAMDAQDVADAESFIESEKEAEATHEKVRTCPNCHKEVPVDDPYVELLCSHCWNPIPAMIKGSGASRAIRVSEARKPPGATGAGGFYAELVSSVVYPLSAIGSLATAAGVAVLAGLVPVAVITGGSNLMEQSAAGTIRGVQEADLSGIDVILMTIFAAEVVFFSAVALHAFLDVVRTTMVGQDKAPNLSWRPSQWGKSALAYLILGIYLVIMAYLVSLLTFDGNPMEYLAKGDVSGLASAGGTSFVVGMIIVSFGIPMNLIGISLGTISQGLHPTNVIKSIGNTHVHYAFLVVIVSVYGALFGWVFVAIVFEWFMPQVDKMIDGSQEGNLTQVALSMLAWGFVMGVFFFGTYILARLHGLFTRSFRKKLMFGVS